MYCSNCGQQVPKDGKVCGHCGARLKTAQNNQKFDLTDAKGTFDNVVSNAKESWASMGKQGILLAIIGALLVLCMFMWGGEIMTISAKGYSRYKYELKGTEILNDSGMMKFLVNVCYLVSIGAVAYPFITKTSVTKKLMMLTRVGVGVNLGAFVGYLIFGFGEAADFLGGAGNFFDLMEYVNIGPSGLGWLLIICFIGILVLSTMVEKEIRNNP